MIKCTAVANKRDEARLRRACEKLEYQMVLKTVHINEHLIQAKQHVNKETLCQKNVSPVDTWPDRAKAMQRVALENERFNVKANIVLQTSLNAITTATIITMSMRCSSNERRLWNRKIKCTVLNFKELLFVNGNV